MADSGANVSRGLGSGAAQVYNTSAPVNMYARLMQQQQLKSAAEAKALKDELGKITPEGIRQADVKGFIDQYGKWRDKSIEANAEKNPTRKALLNQEAERERLATLMYKEDSKDVSKSEDEIHKMLLNPDFKDRYEDRDIQRMINSRKLSKDDSNFIRDYASIQIRPDLSKLAKDLDDLDKNLLQSSQWSAPITEKAMQGNQKGVYVYNKRTIDPQKQILSYASLFDLDRKFQAGLREMFPDLADLPKEQLKAQAIPLLVQQRIKEESSMPTFKADDDWQEKAIFRENLVRARPDKDGVSSSDIKVGSKQFTGTSLPLMDKRTGKPILNKSGSQKLGGKMVTADFPVYSTVNPTAFKMPQLSSVFNITKGVNQPVTEGISASLTGIGYAKVKGGGTQLKATITTDNGEQFIVNPSDLPPDVRNDKFYKITLNAVKEKFGESEKPVTQSNVSGYTNIQKGQDSQGNPIEIGVKNGKWYNIQTGKIYQ